MKFSEHLKTLFFLLILIQFAPPIIKNIKKQYENLIKPKVQVGLIPVKGILYSADRINKYLNKYFKDPNIKAILLKMDCPGGASGTAQSIYQEIQSLKKKHKKPIVTLVENICASGGYYIACATDHIITTPSAIVGSIGVSFQYLFQLQEFIEQFKIKYKAVTAGKYKSTTDPFIDITPEQEKQLQIVLDDSYDQFVSDVSKNRRLPLKTKDNWAQGKIFNGNQAFKLGLVDKIGSPFVAKEVIRDKAQIEIEKEIEWVKPPTKTGLAQFFGAPEEDDNSMFSLMEHKLRAFLTNKVVKPFGSSIQ